MTSEIIQNARAAKNNYNKGANMLFCKRERKHHHTVTLILELKMAVLTQTTADALAATIVQLGTEVQTKLASLPDDGSLQAAVAGLSVIINPVVTPAA